MRAYAFGAVALVVAVAGCADDTRSDTPRSSSAAPSSVTAPTSGAASAASAAPIPDASAPTAEDAGDASVSSSLPGSTEGCPADMVRVRGDYCPAAEQICVEHHDEYKKDEKRKKRQKDDGESSAKSTVSERCIRYADPVECISKEKRPMSFCVDRYEWPNEKGELPALLLSWVDAKKKCEEIGKRLCTEEEFNFACEGEKMLPYTYGFVRDPTKCNIDKPYRKRQRKLYKYERCMSHPACKAAFEAIDQRVPSGSLPECVSPFGAFDMNGNMNEWVMRPGKKYPDRSGLKGGWWGPVRGRCRPTVGFHKEEDYGYEEGFRCCKDAAD